MPTFDLDAARKAGYSDDEIADGLAKTQGVDIEAARKAGYSTADMLPGLVGSAQPDKPKPGLVEDIGTGLMSAAGKVMGAFDKGAVALSDLAPAGFPGKMSAEDRAHYDQRGTVALQHANEHAPERWTGQVAGALAYAPTGAAAPFVMGGAEGYARRQQLLDQGIDEATANKGGASEGALMGAVGAIPFGKYAFDAGAAALAKSAGKATLGAGAAGVAQSVASDAITQKLLTDAGYDEQAKQYAPTMEKAVDAAIFNAAFHGGMQGAHRIIGGKPVAPGVLPEAAAVPTGEPATAADGHRVTGELETIRPLDKARADLEAARQDAALTAVAKDPALSAKAVMAAPDVETALAAAQAIIDAPLPSLHGEANGVPAIAEPGAVRAAGVPALDAAAAPAKLNIFGLPIGVHFASKPESVTAADLKSGDWIIVEGKPLRVVKTKPNADGKLDITLDSQLSVNTNSVSPGAKVLRKVVEAAKPALTAPTNFKAGGAHAEESNVPADVLGAAAAAVDGTATPRVGERATAAAIETADAGADPGHRADGDVQEAPPPVAGWQEKTAAKEARLQEQLRVANENAAKRAAARKTDASDVGLAGEKAPGAKESLELTLRNHPDILRENGSFTPPKWSELPNGFAYRQYVAGGVPIQEVRAPVTSGEKPAILRRGMQKDGQTFGEREATGTLGDVMSGASFADFEQYFSGKPQPKPAPALKPPQSQGERMRAKLHESDPFLGFLAKHGVALEDKADTGAERGNRGNRMVPGYGPVFRKNGLRLDELALRAAEEGHLTQADIDSTHDTGGTGKLADMIRRAVADKEVVKDTAAPEMSPHDIELMQEAQRIGFNTAGLSPDQVYDVVKAHHDKAEQAAEEHAGLVSEQELWAEYERMQDVYHANQAETTAGQRARPVAAHGGADDLAQGNAEARQHAADAAESADFALSGETIAEGRSRVADEERQAAEAKAKQADAERRAQADAARDSFTLTGSDRAADVGAAHGQRDLLAENSPAKDSAEQPSVLPSQQEKVAGKTAPEHDDGADIPHAFMKKTKVPHDVWVEDEGRYETVDLPAHKALKSVREDIAHLTALLNCMKGA